MKKHDQSPKSYSSESARVNTPVINKEPRIQQEPSGKKRPHKRKKKKFHVYVAVLILWLTACTVAIMYGYRKFNDFLIKYETSYQASMPGLVMDEIFVHFQQRDIEYLWNNMSEHPTVSQFEN